MLRRCRRALGVSGALPSGEDGASGQAEIAAHADWTAEDFGHGSVRAPGYRRRGIRRRPISCAGVSGTSCAAHGSLLAVSFLCPACALALTFALSSALTCANAPRLNRLPWLQPIARNARNAQRLSRDVGRAGNERSSATRQSHAASSVAAAAGHAGATAHACSGCRLHCRILASPVRTALPRRKKGLPLCCVECSPPVRQHSLYPTRPIAPQHTDPLFQNTTGTSCALTNSTTSSSPLTPSTRTSCPKVDRRISTTSPSSGARSRSSHDRSRATALRLTLPHIRIVQWQSVVCEANTHWRPQQVLALARRRLQARVILAPHSIPWTLRPLMTRTQEIQTIWSSPTINRPSAHLSFPASMAVDLMMIPV